MALVGDTTGKDNASSEWCATFRRSVNCLLSNGQEGEPNPLLVGCKRTHRTADGMRISNNAAA